MAEPAQVKKQVSDVASALPADAKSLLTTQLSSIAGGSKGGLGLSLVISVLFALWSASGGVMGLINAVNAAYDEKETRSFYKTRGLALLLTVGAIAMFGVAIGLVAVLPPALSAAGIGTGPG